METCIFVDFEEFKRSVAMNAGSRKEYIEKNGASKHLEWQNAAESGVAEAAILYAHYLLEYAKDVPRAMEMFREAARQKQADSAIRLLAKSAAKKYDTENRADKTS